MNITAQVWKCANPKCGYSLTDINYRGGKQKRFCDICIKKHRQEQARGYYHNRKVRPGYWPDLQKKNHERYLLRKNK